MSIKIADQLAEMSQKVLASAIQDDVERQQQAAEIASLKSQLAFSEARVAALTEEKLCLELTEAEAEAEAEAEPEKVKRPGPITQKLLNWDSVSPGTTVRQTVGRKGNQLVKEAIFQGVNKIVPKDPADGASYKSLNAWAVANLKKYAPARKTFTICVYDKSSGVSFLKDGEWVSFNTIQTIVRGDYADGQA